MLIGKYLTEDNKLYLNFIKFQENFCEVILAGFF